MRAGRTSGGRVLLIDTELLLVLAVGAVDPKEVPRWHRTASYSEGDYLQLNAYAATFDAVAVTPNVLTEASNLAGQGFSGRLREQVFTALAALFMAFTEKYVPSKEIVQRPEFMWLGLTDVSVLLAARFALRVLTADALLSDALRNQDIDVININHIRFGTYNT